jgi:hypothetical protein
VDAGRAEARTVRARHRAVVVILSEAKDRAGEEAGERFFPPICIAGESTCGQVGGL